MINLGAHTPEPGLGSKNFLCLKCSHRRGSKKTDVHNPQTDINKNLCDTSIKTRKKNKKMQSAEILD